MRRECDCAGPCGPAAGGVTRREFISVMAAGTAAALMGGPAWARWVQKQGSGEALERWKADLLRKGVKRLYRSDTHTDARMPLGGIGTGHFEIGVDGQLTTWQLFNTLRDGYIPLLFAVRAGETARMLQTRGGPDWPRVAAIEMTGEYPMATLRYIDPALPVKVELTAFSPFAPLDSHFSSMPVACFVFRIINPTSARQTVSLASFMQNPVGYDAMGVPVSFNSVGFNAVAERLEPRHPNFGGNYNRAYRQGTAAVLSFEAEAGKLPILDSPVTIYTDVSPRGLNALKIDRPDHLSIVTLESLHQEGPGEKDRPGGGESLQTSPPAGATADRATDRHEESTRRILWIQDPPIDLDVDILRAARDAVDSGATLVFSGGDMPLLDLYARASEGKAFDPSRLRPDILFEDFEGGYAGWTLEGEAFGREPARGTLPNQQPVTGFSGQGLVNSYLGGDDAKGKLISKTFTIERPYIRFLVGGGRRPTTQIRLIVGGQVVRAASGRDEERLRPGAWDVRDLAGREAHIGIVDEATGGWGHINVDRIAFSDLPGDPAVLEILADLLPARFSGIRPEAQSRTGRAPGGERTSVLPEAGSRGQAQPQRSDDTRGERRAVFEGLEPRPGARHYREENSGRDVIAAAHGRGSVALADGPLIEPGEAELIGARQRAFAALCAIAGVSYSRPVGVPSIAPGHGVLALATLGPDTTALSAFERWESAWEAFAGSGRFEAIAGTQRTAPTAAGHTVNGALASTVVIEPGETAEIPFLLAWRYPNRYSGDAAVGNYYGETWKDIDEVVREAADGLAGLRTRTELFRKTFYDSTLPYWMLDLLTSQISTARHAGVVFRIGDGDVYGWEGSNGCCQPTCTHVWGYEQTFSRFFPDLEQEMRRIDFLHQQREDGGINNRTDVPSPPHPTGEQPFSDGHASCILKAYREALNQPDESWLRQFWPHIRRAVEYLIERDTAGAGGTPDGTLSDEQWNTYDNAVHGVNSFIGTYYLAALRAGEEMARRMGDASAAQRYRAIFERGRRRLVDLCWNGDYFQQHLPGYLERSGEYGPGCLSDQLIGQWWAHQLGLGYLLPEEHVRRALGSIFHYNWLADFTGFEHSWRKFAGGHDKGLLNCTWPKGGRPAATIPYVDEVWTGVEYEVAALLAYEGMLEEALAVAKGARDRYDGVPRPPIPRSPWNEIECGGHYARAMSSWSLLLAVSGFEYDGPARRLSFAPRLGPERFRSFFAGPEGWGGVSQIRRRGSQRNEIAIAEGHLALSRIRLEALSAVKRLRVTHAGRPVRAAHEVSGRAVEVVLPEPVIVRQGEMLRMTLS